MYQSPHRDARSKGLFTPKTRVFSAAEILLRIYQNPIHLNGARLRTTFFRRRNSRCLQNLVRQRFPFKCMGFWYIRSRISSAEKTRVFGVNRPLDICTITYIKVNQVIHYIIEVFREMFDQFAYNLPTCITKYRPVYGSLSTKLTYFSSSYTRSSLASNTINEWKFSEICLTN